jgi:catechol 2,3-dioxygenase-like lactoylglutathione lyase family enzyme
MTGLHHVGYWVPDLAAAVEQARLTLGVGPFLVAEHVRFGAFRLADGTEITDPGYLDHSAAFAAWGPIVLEVAEAHSVDESLAAAYRIDHDRIGHVAWVADDLTVEIERLRAAGCRLIHTAAAGLVEVAWLDGGSLFPHPIEVHRAGPAILGMHDRLSALARDWDGRVAMHPM